MDSLNYRTSENEILHFERIYNDAFDKDTMTDEIKFNYAICLVRSHNSFDINQGVALLKELHKLNPSDLHFMFYLALGYAHLKKYAEALSKIESVLTIESNHRQALALRENILSKSNQETLETVKNVAMVGGGIVAGIGALAGLAMIFSKTKKTTEK